MVAYRCHKKIHKIFIYFFITTRTIYEVIKSGGVRYHSTAEPGVGSVDRRMCTNCVNEQADLIFYIPL
jgi:hypothetical protein